MGRLPRTLTLGLGVGAAMVVFLGGAFLWVAYGEPIHNINISRLQSNFYATDILHPAESVLVEKKIYLGGPSTHGDSRCIYAIGEVRAALLSKASIKNTYQNTTIDFGRSRLPLRVLFADEYDGPQVMPYVNWQDELRNMPASVHTMYVVYASTEQPILLIDLRCDD